jgi:replicative DNA helicase
MSDLRESGSIESDADTIVFVYRDGYYNEKADQGIAELIVAKQRNGPTRTAHATWESTCARFGNIGTYGWAGGQ